MEEYLQKIYEYLAANSLKVVYALVIFFVGCWLAKLAARILEKALAKSKVDPTLNKFLTKLVRVLLMIFVLLAVLEKLEVKTLSFVAVLGAAGLAIGLALQGSLANFAAGILLIIFKPFKIGDFVEIAGAKGTIRKIDIFNTTLDSPDNLRVVVPNAQVTGGNIINYTINGTRRLDLVIGISYEDDIKKAKGIMSEVLSEDERVLDEPASVVAVSELGESSVNFVVRPWVKAEDYWGARFGLT